MSAAERRTPAEYWEQRYGDRRPAWSGNVNAPLAEEAAGLTPGTALDLGCGQGGDAIWLAREGWRVTAVDISPSALAVAADLAAAAGVGERITWACHDLGVSFPSGAFDLVSACYLHSPVELPRSAILRAAAAAVAPGGSLVIVGHAGSPSWAGHGPGAHGPHSHLPLPTTGDVLADLALPTGDWTVERQADVEVTMTDPDGHPATRPDNVLRVRRSGQATGRR